MRLPRGLAGVLWSLLPSLSFAATFTVNSNNDLDDGACNATHCSLREAIVAANATLGADTIRFVIGSGPKTIQVASALPTITDPVTIDGTTQPGFVSAPIIELDGSVAGAGAVGLHVTGGASLVTGLVINRFVPAFPATGGHGIVLETGGGNVVRGCYVGTNLGGTAALANGGDGVQIVASSDNVIGRTNASFRETSCPATRAPGSGSRARAPTGTRSPATGSGRTPRERPRSRTRPRAS